MRPVSVLVKHLQHIQHLPLRRPSLRASQTLTHLVPSDPNLILLLLHFTGKKSLAQDQAAGEGEQGLKSGQPGS